MMRFRRDMSDRDDGLPSVAIGRLGVRVSQGWPVKSRSAHPGPKAGKVPAPGGSERPKRGLRYLQGPFLGRSLAVPGQDSNQKTPERPGSGLCRQVLGHRNSTGRADRSGLYRPPATRLRDSGNLVASCRPTSTESSTMTLGGLPASPRDFTDAPESWADGGSMA